MSATISLVDEIGYPATTVARIIDRARVSRATFYQAFANRDECFLAVFDESLSQAMASAASAYEDAGSWRLGVRAALERLLDVMDEHRPLARLWLVETLRGEEKVRDRRIRAFDGLARRVQEGARASGSCQPPDGAGELIVGGAIAMLHRRLVADRNAPLSELLGPMMYMIVLPFLGARAASAELQRARGTTPREAAAMPSSDDPLEGLKLRLTYRTVRVLDAIGKEPGASNRFIAAHAGISDQGQISKLLARLERLGLATNHGLGQQNGTSNAWTLTPRGARLADAMRPQAGLRT
jgi:AcrR family transcriptional regulator